MKTYQRIVAILGLVIIATGLDAWGQDSKTGVEVINPLKSYGGITSIVLMKPAGSQVKAGEMVCELDGAVLKDQLTNQEIATKSAEAAYQNAKLTREVAEIAVVEYEEGLTRPDKNELRDDIDRGKPGRIVPLDRLEWPRKKGEKGDISPKTVLQRYNHGKILEELKKEVDKSRADEKARWATFEQEQAKEKRLETDVKNLRVVAPADGYIVYPRAIEAGTVFSEGKVLFRIVSEVEKAKVNPAPDEPPAVAKPLYRGGEFPDVTDSTRGRDRGGEPRGPRGRRGLGRLGPGGPGSKAGAGRSSTPRSPSPS